MSLFDEASLVVTPNGVKAGKLYSIKPTDGSGDLSVVRATNATRVNSEGLIESVAANVPRLDYTNGSCPSILIEPQRTNLLIRSNQFSSWSRGGGVPVPVLNGLSDLGLDSYDINFTGASQTLFVPITTISGTIYSWYIYLKGNIGETIFLGAFGGTGNNAKIHTFSGEWEYVKLENFIGTGNTQFQFNTYSGVTGRNFQASFCQLEAGSNATSYIPTVASAVTRNADVISKSGISGLIGQTEGTLYADVNIDNFINGSIITIDSGTSANFIQIFKSSTGDIRVRIRSGSGALPFIIISPLISLGRHKIALNYTNGDYALFIDGIKVGVSTNSTNYPLLPITSFILSATNYGEFNDSYNSVAVWKTRLTDSELATLTTI